MAFFKKELKLCFVFVDLPECFGALPHLNTHTYCMTFLATKDHRCWIAEPFLHIHAIVIIQSAS